MLTDIPDNKITIMDSKDTSLPTTFQHFRHAPLDKEAKQIRLVQILPMDEKSPIRLVLKHAALDDYSVEDVDSEVLTYLAYLFEDTDTSNTPEADDREFIALSYVWGEEDPVHDIEIEQDDQCGYLTVRQNLFDFLVIRRSFSGVSPWFWIDQISINQQDGEEKGHQVNQMAEIYTQATTVEVWLGPAFEGSDEAMKYYFHFGFIEDRAHLEQVRRHYHEPLIKLAGLPYWSRAWILQEFQLNRNLTVRLGQMVVLNDCSARVFIPSPYMWSIWHLMVHRRHKHFMMVPPLGWHAASVLVRDRSCSDTRDKAYSILGLVDKKFRFHPDYSLTTQDILLNILEKDIYFRRLKPATLDHFGLGHTAQWWQRCLNTKDHRIDMRFIRHWLLREAYPRGQLRGLCSSNRWPERTASKLFLPRSGYEHIPLWQERLRLWWMFPSKHSVRWNSKWLRHEFTWEAS
jgi:hypothetical protein